MANATAISVPAPTFGAAVMRAIKSFGLLRESWVGMIGAGLVLFWVMVALLAPLISPFDPNAHHRTCLKQRDVLIE